MGAPKADCAGAAVPEADIAAAFVELLVLEPNADVVFGFPNADVTGAALPNADVVGAILPNADVVGAVLPNADVVDVALPNADVAPVDGAFCASAPNAEGAPKADVPAAGAPKADVDGAALPNPGWPNTDPVVLELATLPAAPKPNAEGCPAKAENPPPLLFELVADSDENAPPLDAPPNAPVAGFKREDWG